MMSEKRFFCKINKNGINVIIDKECHTELFDLTLACEVLNRLDLKLKHYNEVNGEQQATLNKQKEEIINSHIAYVESLNEIKDLKEENELLKKDNQRQKTLRNKHWREIQARANGYNRIISSLENRIPHHIVEELRNAPLLDCDYEGVESNE